MYRERLADTDPRNDIPPSLSEALNKQIADYEAQWKDNLNNRDKERAENETLEEEFERQEMRRLQEQMMREMREEMTKGQSAYFPMQNDDNWEFLPNAFEAFTPAGINDEALRFPC